MCLSLHPKSHAQQNWQAASISTTLGFPCKVSPWPGHGCDVFECVIIFVVFFWGNGKICGGGGVRCRGPGQELVSWDLHNVESNKEAPSLWLDQQRDNGFIWTWFCSCDACFPARHSFGICTMFLSDCFGLFFGELRFWTSRLPFMFFCFPFLLVLVTTKDIWLEVLLRNKCAPVKNVYSFKKKKERNYGMWRSLFYFLLLSFFLFHLKQIIVSFCCRCP